MKKTMQALTAVLACAGFLVGAAGARSAGMTSGAQAGNPANAPATLRVNSTPMGRVSVGQRNLTCLK